MGHVIGRRDPACLEIGQSIRCGLAAAEVLTGKLAHERGSFFSRGLTGKLRGSMNRFGHLAELEAVDAAALYDGSGA